MSQMNDATGGRMLGGQATGGERAGQGPTVAASYSAVTDAGRTDCDGSELQAEADRRNRNDGTRDELTFAAFPQVLKDRPQWVCWKWAVRKNGRGGAPELTKEPYEPNGMRKAKAGDASTWGTYDAAVRTWLTQDVGGIGFEFSDERDVTGADFDHVVVDGHIVDDELAAIIAYSGTYVEVSPSGDGLHLFSLCGKPKGKTRCKRGNYEMYDHGRFFTVTGAMFDGHYDVNAVPDVLSQIYNRYLDAPKAETPMGSATFNDQPAIAGNDPGEGRPSDPGVIYDKLCRTNNAKLQALLRGDTSGYPSHSEADLAMCNYIIFYAGTDASLIDAVFKLTALYRPSKWDRADSGSTHGMRTIGKATSNYDGDFYCWDRRTTVQEGRSEHAGHGMADAERNWAVGMSWRENYFDPKSGRFMHESLAEDIVREAHASRIDGAPAVFAGGLWRLGYAPMERLCSDVQPRLTSSQRNEVIKDINLRPHATSPEDFDGRCYIAFTNGILCVETGEFVNPSPQMYVMGRIPAEFDADAPEGMADVFLDTVTDGDREARLVLEEFVGQAMCARQVIRQSLMLTGDISDELRNASTGKSTFLGFVTTLLGDANVSSLKPSILGDRFQAAQLVGKLANIAADIPDDELSGKALAMFKCMVTGDMIYTDVKNKQGFGFRSHATIAFAMNVVPRFADTTDGVWRRLCFIPFRHRFTPGIEGYDPNMDKQLAKPQNLQRLALLGVNALRGAIERGTDTYSRCEAGELVKQRVITENDSVLMWIYTEKPGIIGWRPAACFSNYLEWCHRLGISHVTIGQFTPRVNKHCHTKTQPGSDRHRVFVPKA